LRWDVESSGGGLAVADPLLLTPEQQKELRRQARRAVGRVAERIHYVLLARRGYDVEEIAVLYAVEARTVHLWLTRFREAGVGALDDLPRSGRPRLASGAAQAEAAGCLEASPERVGLLRTTWTRRLLGQHLGERFGSWLSPRSVARLIHRLGYVWTRPTLTAKRDDPAALERETAIQAAIAAHPTAPRLYEDECEFHQVPVLRGQYQRPGQQRAVPTPGTNRKQSVFGFLNGLTGAWHFWLTLRKRSIDFLGCLHELYQQYSDGPILLFLDNTSIHKSQVTLRWLANHPRFLVRYLPAYSGHQTNPVEKVWWALKAAQMANELYASREAIQDAICGYFATFSPARALQLTQRHTRERSQEPERDPRQPTLPLAA